MHTIKMIRGNGEIWNIFSVQFHKMFTIKYVTVKHKTLVKRGFQREHTYLNEYYYRNAVASWYFVRDFYIGERSWRHKEARRQKERFVFKRFKWRLIKVWSFLYVKVPHLINATHASHLGPMSSGYYKVNLVICWKMIKKRSKLNQLLC